MNSIRRLFRCLTTLVLLAMCGVPVSVYADTLYGITFGDGTNRLITINQSTGAGSLVGPLSSSMAPFGLGVRAGKLYTFDQREDVIRQLSTVDGSTVDTIDVGLNLLGEGGIDFRSDGIGFIDGANDAMYSFDITAPNSSFIGDPGPAMDGLAFDASDVLYGLSEDADDGGSELYTINQSTAAITLIGALGVGVGAGLGGLAFRSDGALFAAISGPDFSTSTLYIVDKSTGEATLVGDIGFDRIAGLAFLVPEPSTFILAALGCIGLRLAGRGKK